MTPEQEAAREAALADRLSPRERKLLQEGDGVPTLDDYEDDRSDGLFQDLLDAEFDSLYSDDDEYEPYDDDKDYA